MTCDCSKPSDYKPEYRIVESDLGFEPQIKFLVRGAERWFPLNREGYWADPDGWNDDDIKVRHIMSERGLAESALVKAQAVNGTNISVAK